MFENIVLISNGAYAILILIGMYLLARKIDKVSKKELKDQQEIKTKLTNIKKRQYTQMKGFKGGTK